MVPKFIISLFCYLLRCAVSSVNTKQYKGKPGKPRENKREKLKQGEEKVEEKEKSKTKIQKKIKKTYKKKSKLMKN